MQATADVVPQLGDFSFIKHELSRDCLQDAWDSVQSDPEFIKYVANKPTEDAWVNVSVTHPVGSRIVNSLKLLDVHSGCSLACTMRTIESILKRGWNQWYIRQTIE